MGRPVTHWQIDAREPARLQQFYTTLFDWSVDANNPLNYGFVGAEQGGIAGGIGPAAERSGVTFFVEVADLQASLDQAERLGGRTLLPPTVIPGAVSLAMFADPEGNRIGLLRGRGSTVKADDLAEGAAPLIRELTPELVEDYLNFFDHDAFADNPAWASCYCMESHRSFKDEATKDAAAHTGDENRAAKRDLICGGRAHGLLAYVEGHAAGWCNAGPRGEYPGLDRFEGHAIDADERIGSIVCFVIAAPFRRRGLARRLLEAACESFRRQGLAYAEAYPAKDPRSDASAYHGPPALYLATGFSLYRELGNRLVVRKRL